jgi:hypothetical protein
LCGNTKDILDSQGLYVKTICLVDQTTYYYNAKISCEYEDMKLANPNEYLNELTSFAFQLYPNGGDIYVAGTDGHNCSRLSATLDSGLQFVTKSGYCQPWMASYCEYNSKDNILSFKHNLMFGLQNIYLTLNFLKQLCDVSLEQ